MTQYYPIQVIALDDTAQQALDLAELTRFDQLLKSDLETLSSKMISEYHQVIVLSQLTANTTTILANELTNNEDPIIILPDTLQETQEVKQLLLDGIRVIVTPSDTLLSISLSHTLKIIESLFYGNGTESEIDIDHKDIYEVIKRGTITELHESKGVDIPTTMMRLLNTPQGYDDAAGAIFLFALHEDRSLMEISESMDIAEDKLPKEAYILLESRNTVTDPQSVTITSLVSRYYDFEGSLQKEINESESYLGRVSVIVDAFAQGIVTGDEADLMAERNGLNTEDLSNIYSIVYTEPAETVKLIGILADEKIDTNIKVEVIADMLIDSSVNTDIVEALVSAYSLSTDEILLMVDIKNEGKLPLRKVEIPTGLKERYPHLGLAESAGTLVLLDQDDLGKEEGGTVTVKTDELKVYERNGVEWYVSKNLDQDVIDAFIGEYRLF